jgi:hypothetical protein
MGTGLDDTDETTKASKEVGHFSSCSSTRLRCHQAGPCQKPNRWGHPILDFQLLKL